MFASWLDCDVQAAPSMHLSAWKASDKKTGGIQPRQRDTKGICGFRQPGDLVAKSTQLKTHGFAPPVFTGFAFVGLLQGYVSKKFYN